MVQTETLVSTEKKLEIVRTIDTQVVGPSAIVVDAQGNFLVTEEFGHQVKKYDASFNLLWVSGVKGYGKGEFLYPTGVVSAADGTIFVTNRWNHRVDVLDADGACIQSFGSFGEGPNQFIEPMGIELSRENELYIVDRGNARVCVYSCEGECIRTFGACGTAIDFYESEQFKRGYHYTQWLIDVSKMQPIETFFHDFNFDVGDFEYPESIAIDSDGSVYVTDRVSKKVVVFEKNRTHATVLSHPECTRFLDCPMSVRIFGDTFLVGDELNQKIYMKSGQCEHMIDLSEQGIKPTDMYLNSFDNTLYITDAWHDRIHVCALH